MVLFRDDFSCQQEAFRLWQVSLACLISYYVNMVINCVVISILRCVLMPKNKK